MELDRLRSLIDGAPDSSHPELDPQARAWLSSADLEVTVGDGEPVVLVALAVDEDMAVHVYAIPGESLDVQAHSELAAVHRAAFEHFFMSDLEPAQFAGALRILGGRSEEPDVFEELIEEVEGEGEAEDLPLDAIRASAGTWNALQLVSGAALRGPVSHFYAATLCM